MDDERIERALRAGPPDEDRYAPPALDLGDRPRTAAATSVRPRAAVSAWLMVAALAVAVGLVALSGGLLPPILHGGPPPGGAAISPVPASPVATASSPALEGVVPWLDAPVAVPPWPTPITVTPPPGLAPCVATDLKGELSGWGAAAGTTYFRLHVTNASKGTCYLQGTPGAQVLDGHGQVVLDGTKAVGAVPGRPSVAGGDPVGVLTAGASTDVPIGWSDWCGPAISGPFSFAVVLPRDGGRLVASWAPGIPPLDRPVTCMGGATSEVFANGPFQPPAGTVPATPEPTPLPLQVAIDQGTLTVASTTVGTPIRYTITLTNTSAAPVDLRSFAGGQSCPVYEEEIIGQAPAFTQAFTLNCASVNPIAPGASVSFAMQMPTVGLPAGDYTFSWILAPQEFGPGTKASVTLR